MRMHLLPIVTLLLLPAASPAGERTDRLKIEVESTERAFAATMARRDYAAFQRFLAREAVFMNGPEATHGDAAIAAAWKSYFEGPKAPFSWEPSHVEVLPSGRLAFSTGPVFDPDGKRIGTFNSVWRREGQGRWRIVFDNGCPPCGCR
jgi:ketosteroid isomerase-like protein